MIETTGVQAQDAVMLAGIDGDVALWDVTLRVLFPTDDAVDDSDGIAVDDDGIVVVDHDEQTETLSVVIHTTSMTEALLRVESHKAYFLDKLGYDSAECSCEVVGLFKNEGSLFLVKDYSH